MEKYIKANHDLNHIEDECTYLENLGLSDAPEVHCRIGDEFQVKIPPLISKSTYLTLTKTRTNPTFLIGLPISLVWINNKVEHFNPETQDFLSHLNGLSNTDRFSESCSTNGIDFFEEIQNGGKGYRLVPGSIGAMWSNAEEASFLLGLYIFGKNFVKVVKLVETKDMGELLSFYYSRFYSSDKYRRWSGFRKVKSKRCIYGERIFSGSTHHQLLSQLFLHISEDQRNTLSEVAKAYGEGKTMLEDYICALKGIAGMKNLIEVVGIGKGKQDLTRISMEHPKSSQSGSIPVGKACSSLTPLEITNLLNGGFRLSKARSSELFWEAVWPRLLAKGWHSEKPGESRNSLVFLVPGVKKFLRRKLVKGEDFFDSVSDVLSKVASDPRLLEFDSGVESCENGDTPGQQRHCYLKPRAPSCTLEAMKFTVIDTSLTKVREQRSFPVETMNVSVDSEVSDSDPSDEALNESDSSNGMPIDLNKNDASNSMKIVADDDVFIVSGFEVPREPAKEPKIGICTNDMKPDMPVKARLTNQPRTRDSNPSTRVAKHRRVDEKPIQDPDSQMNSHPDGAGSSSTDGNSPVREHQNEKPQPRLLIDLNIPLPEEIEDESITMDPVTNERTHNKGNKLAEEKPTFEQPPSVNCPRKSTRNRPLSTKALEALSCGFLSTKQKKHRRDGFQLEDSMSRPPRRARSQVVITENFEGNERKNKGNDMIGEVQV